MRGDPSGLSQRGTGLVDVLDRVLDKGLVVAGDIKISLAEVELLTIRIRLIVCSMDKAEAMGLDWWKHDRHLSPGSAADKQVEELRAKIAALEAKLERRTAASRGKARQTTARGPRRRTRNAG